MGNYSFSDEAVKDIEDICDYLARDNPRTAGKIFDAIRQKCKLIANFPKMGKAYPQLARNLRGFVVENYIVFYYPREDGITIARVVSGYRDLDFLFTDE
jgi:toxin ParE1/3/4